MQADAVGFWVAVLLMFTADAGLGSETPTAVTGDLAELFITANQAYESGEFATAIGAYRTIVEAGSEDGRVYYNLGNAYLRNGELGSAIAAYRRGRTQRPRDQDLAANLEFARGTTKDAIDPPRPSALVSTLLFWYYSLSPRELAVVVLCANLMFWGLAAVRIFRPDNELLKWGSVALLVILIATGGSLVSRRWLTPPVAVIVPQEVDAFTAPDLESVVRFKLHAGTELRIRDQREGWIRVALPDGQQGWVEASWVDVVE